MNPQTSTTSQCKCCGSRIYVRDVDGSRVWIHQGR